MNSLTYSAMCWSTTSGSISCACASTYARLAAGSAQAARTEARIQLGGRDRVDRAPPGQDRAERDRQPGVASHHSPRSTSAVSPYRG